MDKTQLNSMKKILIGVTVLLIHLTGNGQPMEKDFWLWKQGDTLIRRGGVERKYEWVILPRPLTIRYTPTKVVVTYPKGEWKEAQRINRYPVLRGEDNRKLPPGYRYWNQNKSMPLPKPQTDNRSKESDEEGERMPEVCWENRLWEGGKVRVDNWATYNVLWGEELGVALYIRINK